MYQKLKTLFIRASISGISPSGHFSFIFLQWRKVKSHWFINLSAHVQNNMVFKPHWNYHMVSYDVYGTMLLLAFIVMDWFFFFLMFCKLLLNLFVESLDISVLKKFNLKNLSSFYIYTHLRVFFGWKGSLTDLTFCLSSETTLQKMTKFVFLFLKNS